MSKVRQRRGRGKGIKRNLRKRESESIRKMRGYACQAAIKVHLGLVIMN